MKLFEELIVVTTYNYLTKKIVNNCDEVLLPTIVDCIYTVTSQTFELPWICALTLLYCLPLLGFYSVLLKSIYYWSFSNLLYAVKFCTFCFTWAVIIGASCLQSCSFLKDMDFVEHHSSKLTDATLQPLLTRFGSFSCLGLLHYLILK